MDSALAEIKNGTFYFASREELNDPIEGHVKLYFQGDQLAWEGLLKNYICSLFISIERFLVVSPIIDYHNKSLEDILKDLNSTTVIVDIHHFDTVPLGKILKDLGIIFLNDESVQKLVSIYGSREEKCFSKELKLILRAVHYKAFNICIQHFKSNGFTINVPEMPSTSDFPFESLKKMNHSEWIKFAEEAEDSITDMMEWLNSITKISQEYATINNQIPYNHKQHMTWASIQVNFPKIYVERLQDVIYPNGYVVCFSTTPTDSAMWGNYAQNHQGICFIYETKTLNKQNFMQFGSRNLKVTKITYSKKVIERNFFTTFGRLTYAQIQSWLTGKDGATSKLMDTFSEESLVSWRNKYWNDYVEKFHRKNPAWKHEKEYRILLHDTFYQYDKKENRYLQYEPSSLKGIIFGINTSVDDKCEIIQTIQKAGDKFKNVEFFQAEYEENTQKIIIRKKSFLNPKSTEDKL